MALSAAARERMRYLILTGALGLAAFALSIFFFCPHFAIWRGLSITEAHFNPEVNRAVDALKQLEHPFAKIRIRDPKATTQPADTDDAITIDKSNRVIQWRLLFPIIAHYLYFPHWLF